MQSVGDEVESGSGSDWSDHEVYRELLHHEAHVLLPYEEDDSSSDEEMACPLPLYDNAPLSVSASWQAIMHFTLHVTMNFINQYVRHQKESPAHLFVGRRKKKSLLSSTYEAVKQYTGLNLPNLFETAEMLKKDGVLFRTEKEGYTRCSSFCTFMDGTFTSEKIENIQSFIVNPPLVILKLYRKQMFVPAVRPSRRSSIRNCTDLAQPLWYHVEDLSLIQVLSIKCLQTKCIFSSGVVFRLPNFYEHH